MLFQWAQLSVSRVIRFTVAVSGLCGDYYLVLTNALRFWTGHFTVTTAMNLKLYRFWVMEIILRSIAHKPIKTVLKW